VSLSLRDELRVVIYRDQVQIVRVGREFTLRGRSCRVIEKKNFPCMSGDESFWDDAIRTLATALSELPVKPAYARVILSNHFLSYAMVELNQALNGEAEELAYAKHRFGQLYGPTAASWEIRLSQDFAAGAQMASAVDSAFLENLRATFAKEEIRLKSVQPYLMAAYNNCLSDLKDKDAWFVLFEHGNLCIGQVQQGHWNSIRTFNVDKDWFEKLNEILDRESYLSETDISSDTIFLWAPEYIKTELPKSSRWKVNKLKPLIPAGFAHDFDEQYAIAMCG
jgi:hypothetical protein